jgi:glyoxylase-like metal-dependent hydrolase (beta-lactamase superfamily II)
MPADVLRVGPLGPYANNVYIVADRATKRALLVDAPIGSAEALAAAKSYGVAEIVVTHRHGDHWAEIDAVKKALAVPVRCHEADRAPYAQKVDGTVNDGDEIALGETRVRVIHTPGHTPGSICLLVETPGALALISGDTLFPGGPGRSGSPADLRQMIDSITAKLLVLPGDTAVHPGHGDGTTIAASQREYAVFASKTHDPNLCGDVTWEGA